MASNRHPLYPEPGTSVIDTFPGMPEAQQPEPLPKGGRLEGYQIRDYYVAYEGLGVCIYELIPAHRIADPELRLLWRKARRAMKAVVDCLEEAPEPRMDKRQIVPYRKRPKLPGGAEIIGDTIS